MNLQPVSKAIAGAIVTAAVAYLSQHNIVLGAGVSDAITVIVAAIVGFLGVFIAPRNRQ